MIFARIASLPFIALRFCLSGGLASVMHFTTMYLALQAGVSPAFSTALGAVVGAWANYLLQYRLTFHSRQRHRVAAVRFACTVVVSWALNLLIFVELFSLFNGHLLLVQGVTTAAVALCNYWMMKHVVFFQDVPSNV